MVTGNQCDELVRLIRDRIQHGKGTSSKRKLALVVEGGAMRGTYTAGALLGLHLLGATHIFDSVYATSAGAVNSAHFLSGVGHLKAATYYKALADGRFFNPLRFPRPVDVDFLFDVVLRHEIPLEMDLLAKSGSVLKVAVVNYDDGTAEMKTMSASDATAWDTLKAAVAMPVVYNKTIRLAGGRYVDGGMAIPYPLLQAVDDGMTDVVVLLSHDPSKVARPRGLFQYLLWALVFAKGRHKLIRMLETWHVRMRELDSLATGRTLSAGRTRILCIAPEDPKISSSTQSRAALRAGCIEMAKETLSLFGVSQEPLDALIRKGIL